MKKIFFILVAIMAMSVSFAANAQEATSRTVIISNFSSRAVKVEMPLFYKMATGEAKGFSLVQADDTTGRMNGFITVVSAYDAEEGAQCIKIRIANGKDMTILSFFNGWASEVNSKFVSAGGYAIGESEDTITITKGEAKLVLNKADFAKSILTVVENIGWNEIK